MSDIQVDRQNDTALITLNRPAKRNAITRDMYFTLQEELAALETDPAIRVLVLTGAGDDFSAGYDLSQGPYESGIRAYLKEVSNPVLWALWEGRIPSIARIRGYCLGGACELALACDFVVATEDSIIGEPELRYGILPDFLIVPWLVPLRVARELLLMGKRFRGDRAAEVGLINRAVPAAELDSAVEQLAKRLRSMPAGALQRAKLAINRVYEIQGIRQSVEMGEELSVINNLDPDAETRQFRQVARREGLRAALEWLESGRRDIDS
ncbi:MAG: enoyl-CoA hydratase/isomerase family protein [bacterium]